MNSEAFDICECGDYRHQHEAEGQLDCTVCSGDLGGYELCRQFRLWQRFEPKWRYVR